MTAPGAAASSISEAEHSKILLTVCIPTYKRAPFVEAQVRSVIAHVLANYPTEAELVVVNNCSPDDTTARLTSIRHKNFKLVNLTKHLDTAEENMMRALRHVGGEYVWFLGDDEVIHPPGVATLLEILRKRRVDCLIFNSPTISNNGSLELLQPIPMQGAKIDGSISQIVEAIGLLYTFAGFSNLVHRTSKLDSERGLRWLRSSKIYSHVAWFIQSHRESKTSLINSALVFYRQNDYSSGHWDRVAEKQGVQDLYFWSLGLARLLAVLVDEGCLTFAQAGQILEVGQAGNRYKLLNDLVMKIFQQMTLWKATNSARQAFTSAEIVELYNFCLSADPSLYNILSLIKDAHAMLVLPDTFETRDKIFETFERKFRELFASREGSGEFLGRFVCRLYGSDIYRMPFQYVGIVSGDEHLREAVLRTVDPVGDGLNVVVGLSLEEIGELAKMAAAQRVVLERRADSRAEAPQVITMVAPPPSTPPPVVERVSENSLIEALLRREAANVALAHQVEMMKKSTSWSVTGPLRAVSRIFKRGVAA